MQSKTNKTYRYIDGIEELVKLNNVATAKKYHRSIDMARFIDEVVAKEKLFEAGEVYYKDIRYLITDTFAIDDNVNQTVIRCIVKYGKESDDIFFLDLDPSAYNRLPTIEEGAEC